jgi:hypothetical protein
MSVTIGGTAPNPCRSSGSWSFDAGSGGIVAVFSIWNLPSSRHQVQIEPSRFVVSYRPGPGGYRPEDCLLSRPQFWSFDAQVAGAQEAAQLPPTKEGAGRD